MEPPRHPEPPTMQPAPVAPSPISQPSLPNAEPDVEPQLSGLAVAGFVMSLLPFCMIHLVGLVLGAVAWSQINGRPKELKGKGLAIAAVIIGSFWLVIAVVGVIAAIAIPSFLNYQGQSRQTEARSNLNSIHSAQMAYFSERERYADSFGSLGWSLATGVSHHYTYYLGDDVIPPTNAEAQPLPMDLATYANRDGYQVAAVANIDEDPTLDVWVIGDDGWADNVVDDTFE